MKLTRACDIYLALDGPVSLRSCGVCSRIIVRNGNSAVLRLTEVLANMASLGIFLSCRSFAMQSPRVFGYVVFPYTVVLVF